MDLMNRQEYIQACLFRIREALETTKAWWEHSPQLTSRKIEQTVDMLEDIIDELKYFQEKVELPQSELVSYGLFKE